MMEFKFKSKRTFVSVQRKVVYLYLVLSVLLPLLLRANCNGLTVNGGESIRNDYELQDALSEADAVPVDSVPTDVAYGNYFNGEDDDYFISPTPVGAPTPGKEIYKFLQADCKSV